MISKEVIIQTQLVVVVETKYFTYAISFNAHSIPQIRYDYVDSNYLI